jgi:hypothetical protein
MTLKRKNIPQLIRLSLTFVFRTTGRRHNHHSLNGHTCNREKKKRERRYGYPKGVWPGQGVSLVQLDLRQVYDVIKGKKTEFRRLGPFLRHTLEAHCSLSTSFRQQLSVPRRRPFPSPLICTVHSRLRTLRHWVYASLLTGTALPQDILLEQFFLEENDRDHKNALYPNKTRPPGCNSIDTCTLKRRSRVGDKSRCQ